jgi:hypothetical protein
MSHPVFDTRRKMTRHLVEEAACCGPDYNIPDNGDPVDWEPTGKAQLSRARMKALVVLDHLMANDPDFEGVELTTDKLFAYVRPPKEYYRAIMELGTSLFQSSATRDLSSADLRKRLQDKVSPTGYSVPRNCCNKPLFDWQLEDIAKATGVPFDKREVNSLSKLQAYANAWASGEPTWKSFHLAGYYSNDAVAFVEGRKPRKHKIFKTNTGYPVFKRGGCKITMGAFKALVGEE